MTCLANCLSSPQVVLPWVYALIGGPLYLVGLLIPTIRIGNLFAQLTIVPTLLTLKVRKWAYFVATCLQASSRRWRLNTSPLQIVNSNSVY